MNCRRSRLAAGTGLVCLGLALVLAASQLSFAQGDKSTGYKEKLKDLENAYRKTLGDALKDSEDLEKKADETLKTLVDEQLKAKGKEAKEKAKIAVDRARDDKEKIANVRKQYQKTLAGLRATFGWDKMEDHLGILVAGPSPILVEQLGLGKGEGMVVIAVPAKTLAAKLGVKTNDIILKLDGKTIPSDPPGYLKLVNDIKPDAGVEVTVLRQGKQQVLSGSNPPAVEPTKKIEPKKSEPTKKEETKKDEKKNAGE